MSRFRHDDILAKNSSRMDDSYQVFLLKLRWFTRAHYLNYGKTGNKKHATCHAAMLKNELNSDVAPFTTHIKPVWQQIRLLTGLNLSGKTRNIAFQLVPQ